MKRRIFVLFALLFTPVALFFGQPIFAEEPGSVIDRVRLSGFFRVQNWYISGDSEVPGYFPATDSYKQVYYQDIFFRNRFDLRVLPSLEIKSVFDIGAKFGKGDFSMGNASTNLVTRDVYAVFTPGENSEFSIGLMPFSLPGGYVLARDATGMRFAVNLLEKKLQVYTAFINAFDNADDSFGKDTDPPDYANDFIFFGGLKSSPSGKLLLETYYLCEIDRFTDDSDNRKSTLHWLGLHGKWSGNTWFVLFGGIFNSGELVITQKEPEPSTESIDIMAGLFEFETGFKFKKFQAGLAFEGATGNPLNAESSGSFQDIKASHGFSFIAVDSSGGLAIRGSGESPWYGLYGTRLKIQYILLESFLLKMNFFHFGTVKSLTWKGSSSTWFGEEVDFSVEYKYDEVISVYLNTGIFQPQDAYFAMVENSGGGVILEILLGAMATY